MTLLDSIDKHDKTIATITMYKLYPYRLPYRNPIIMRSHLSPKTVPNVHWLNLGYHFSDYYTFNDLYTYDTWN